MQQAKSCFYKIGILEIKLFLINCLSSLWETVPWQHWYENKKQSCHKKN
jgi:hypothetical protein